MEALETLKVLTFLLGTLVAQETSDILRKEGVFMYNVRHVLLSISAVLMTAGGLSFGLPRTVWAQAKLENPQPGSFQSGIGVVSGWACEAQQITLVFDGVHTFSAAYGTARGDTQSTCGDTNNGFGMLVNWNLLGNGPHTVQALRNGVEFAHVTVTVTTLGEEFLRGVSGQTVIDNFPQPGNEVTLSWQESLQNFTIKESKSAPPPNLSVLLGTWQGVFLSRSRPSATLAFSFSQSGSTLTGGVTLTGSACASNGTVTSVNIPGQFFIVNFANGAEAEFETFVASDGSALGGVYEFTSGPCNGEGGSWSVVKWS